MNELQKRTWAEINLGNISHNVREMCAKLPEGCRFLGVIKANAYGHGAVQVAQCLEKSGCSYLAVACLDEALELRKAPPLSKASLEVLAIIAYNQPATRSFIEMVRGVDSSAIVASLVDKGLVAERGTLDAPGRPTLFGTTDAFLRCFGLESIDDLPKTELQMSGEQVSLDFTEENENTSEQEAINDEQ